MTETVIQKNISKAVAPAGKYLGFRLADEIYALEILRVQEIISLINITRVPRVPDFVAGVINLRGKVIPVMNIRLKLGFMKVEYTEKTCIIVVEIFRDGYSVSIGIIVDEVSEVITLGPENIAETPSLGASVNTEYLMGIGKSEGRIVMLLDIDRIFSKDLLGIDENHPDREL